VYGVYQSALHDYPHHLLQCSRRPRDSSICRCARDFQNTGSDQYFNDSVSIMSRESTVGRRTGTRQVERQRQDNIGVHPLLDDWTGVCSGGERALSPSDAPAADSIADHQQDRHNDYLPVILVYYQSAKYLRRRYSRRDPLLRNMTTYENTVPQESLNWVCGRLRV
jgi:hypothetical protein